MALVGFCGGCCRFQTAFVPVREAVYRTEVAVTNRLALPLNNHDREFLLTFLKSGRNPALDSDATISDPEATQRYAGLIALLGDTNQLWVTNLVAGDKFAATTAFRSWFPQPAVRQVVDAHEDWPPALLPYALLDSAKRNWWVFYHARKRLTHLMVTRALVSEKPR